MIRQVIDCPNCMKKWKMTVDLNGCSTADNRVYYDAPVLVCLTDRQIRHIYQIGSRNDSCSRQRRKTGTRERASNQDLLSSIVANGRQPKIVEVSPFVITNQTST